MKTGFSLYLGSGLQKNKEVILKSVQAGSEYVFTSLHIMEEQIDDYPSEVKTVMNECKKHHLKVMVDVSSNTINKLNIDSLEELKEWGFTHLRIDWGITNEEIVDLSQTFVIVLNTSTITKQDLIELQNLGAQFDNFLACHNFYPKPLTAISLQECRKKNHLLQEFGILTMGFVNSDTEKRGPLYQGLPTVESHRNDHVLENMLELHFEGLCDVICIGDVDCSDHVYSQLTELNQGFVSLRCEIEKDYHYLCDLIHHDRIDPSEHLFRSVESRQKYYATAPFKTIERRRGDLCVSNNLYLRYEGEFEIMKKDHPQDDRVNVVGKVMEEDLGLFEKVGPGLGIKLLAL